MNSRKNIFWLVMVTLIGSILLYSCTSNKSSEEKTNPKAESSKSREAEISSIATREKIMAINPSKIHIDSEGHIITKDMSYEEMRELAMVLTELSESGQIRFSKEYTEVKDNRGRTISRTENGSVTTYEYPKNPYIPFATSSRTVKEEENNKNK